MTYYALLKPFKWPHSIILNLPHSLESLLGSPAPILIGFNFFLITCILFNYEIVL